MTGGVYLSLPTAPEQGEPRGRNRTRTGPYVIFRYEPQPPHTDA